MKQVLMGAALLVALTPCGCYESLTSIVTPDVLVFDPDLPGDYAATDPSAGRVTIAKGGAKGYTFQQYDPKGAASNKGTLRVVKLGGEQFYQLTVDGYATTDGKPIYAIGRLVIEGKPGAKTLTGYSFKTKEQLFDAIGVATSDYTYKEGGEEKRGRALSMSTEEIQKYLAAHGAEMNEMTLKYQQTAR